jgi:hypothetical protein
MQYQFTTVYQNAAGDNFAIEIHFYQNGMGVVSYIHYKWLDAVPTVDEYLQSDLEELVRLHLNAGEPWTVKVSSNLELKCEPAV